MSEKPWAEKTLEERYNHAPGQFGAVVDAFEIPGEPELSMLVRRVCRELTVWPEQLVGYALAHEYSGAVPNSVPLSTGRCDGPQIGSRFADARRLIWRGAYELTDLSIENIAALFGYSPSTVRPWATSWKRFEAQQPVWWRFWGPARADLIGVPLDEPYDPASEAEAILRGAAA